MPIVSSPDLEKLRKDKHRTELFASFLRPATLFNGRINDATIGRGETEIIFDNGIIGNVSVIQPYQELWVGTAVNRFDICKIRIRSFSTSDGGITGTISIPGNSFVFVDNAYLSIRHNYPVLPAYPLLDNAGVFYKDRVDEYNDENELPPPVVVAGPHRVGIYESGQCVFEVDASTSYAIAEGATIASYGLSVTPTPTSIVFDTNTGIGTITIASVSNQYYWAKFTVTDSNGKSQVSYRCLIVQTFGDSGASEGLVPVSDLSINQITGEWDRGGWYAQIVVSGNDVYYGGGEDTPGTSLAYIPDETLCILWKRSYYNNEQVEIGFDFPEIVLVGYTSNEYLDKDMKTGHAKLTLNITTVEEILKNNFMFSISLAAVEGTPSTWYEYQNWLTVGRAIHHVLRWHSSLLQVCDVIGLTDDLTPRPYGDLESGTLMEIVNGLSMQHGIRWKLVSDKTGRLRFMPDIQLLTNDERDDLDTTFKITGDDLAESFVLLRNRVKRVAYVFVSGISWDGSSWDSDGVPVIGAYCSVAPGIVPGYGGGGTVNFDRQTVLSQEHTDQIAGRILARENALYPELRLVMHGDYSGVFDIAYPEWYVIDIDYLDTARNIAEPNLRLACRQVVVIPDQANGILKTEVVFEPESLGQDGEPGICLDSLPDTGGEPDPIPASSSAIVTSSSIYVRLDDDSVWTNRATDNSNDMVQDPFWSVTQGSSYASDAILFKCGTGYIRKTMDLWSTSVVVTPTTNPPNDSVDSPAPTAIELDYIYLGSNPVLLGSFAVAARWQNNSNEWRSWLVITSDYGATWTWKGIT